MTIKNYYDEITPLTYTVSHPPVYGALGKIPLKVERVMGEASFAHRVIRTPLKAVREVLKKKLGIQIKKDQDKFMKGHSFYTLLLDFAVRLEEPVNTFLEFARFRFKLGTEADILTISPAEKGVQAMLKKFGERNIIISPSLEIGPSVTVTQKGKNETTSKQKEQTVEAGVGAKMAAEFDYNNKKGWSLEVPKFVTDIKGAKLQANVAQWEIFAIERLRYQAK